MSERAGHVYLVGAGPGDPGLITVRGVDCLRRAEVVVYDYLASRSLLQHAPAGAELIYVGKKAGQHTMKQEEINALLVAKGGAGKVVVRLKGGDPYVFGRGGEEGEALRNAGIAFETVPGITSGIAAPCYAGIPVTHRSAASSIALITGHEDPAKEESSIAWEHLARGVDTLVFYMGVGNLARIAGQLMAHGRPETTPVAVIRWGTRPQQQTVTGTLSTIARDVEQAGLKPPAVTIVGEVVSLRETLRWFDNRPLSGKRIVNTRSRGQASQLTLPLEALGAEVLELPTIDIIPEQGGSELDKTIRAGLAYDWILFTSPNGVHAFFDLLLAAAPDVRALGNAQIGCIGPGTRSALESYHVCPSVTADRAVGEGFAQTLVQAGPWEGKRVLLARAFSARDVVPESLTAAGARVDIRTAYTTVPARNRDEEITEALLAGEIDAVTFSSSSTFEHFKALFSPAEFCEIVKGLKGVSMGPVTSQTMRDHGVEPAAEAAEPSMAGLAEAIRRMLVK